MLPLRVSDATGVKVSFTTGVTAAGNACSKVPLSNLERRRKCSPNVADHEYNQRSRSGLATAGTLYQRQGATPAIQAESTEGQSSLLLIPLSRLVTAGSVYPMSPSLLTATNLKLRIASTVVILSHNSLSLRFLCRPQPPPSHRDLSTRFVDGN